MNLSARLSQWFDVGRNRLDWQALLNYRSSFFLTQYNEDDIVVLNGTRQSALTAGFPDRQKGCRMLNLGIGCSIDRFRIEVWVSNVLDEEVSQKAPVGSSLHIRFLNDARTYGLRGRVTF
ncbi:hypothetical protein [uncultured Sphingomonas sp.]|uniref:hypothetical protein n=1 Tax=uncultured Sphingomonas sp. TaxID=158754 RepID=UPI0037497406